MATPYRVSERGTPRQAVALGSVVTFSHTASVIGIGMAVLAAGRYIVPGVLGLAMIVAFSAGLAMAVGGVSSLAAR